MARGQKINQQVNDLPKDPRENIIVEVKPVLGRSLHNMFSDSHDGATIFSRAIIQYPVRMSSATKIIPLFTSLELDWIASFMNEPRDSFEWNSYGSKKLFWRTLPSIRIDKDGNIERGSKKSNKLDLSDLDDLFIYKILQTYDTHFAPSWLERNNGDFRFAFSRGDEDAKTTVSYIEKRNDATNTIFKLANDSSRMKAILKLLNRPPVAVTTNNELKASLLEIAELREGTKRNPGIHELLDVLNDTYLDTRIFAMDAINVGSLILSGSQYIRKDNGSVIAHTIEELHNYTVATDNADWVGIVDQKAVNNVQ